MSSDSLMGTPMRPAHTEKYSATLMTLREDGLKQKVSQAEDQSMLMYVLYVETSYKSYLQITACSMYVT